MKAVLNQQKHALKRGKFGRKKTCSVQRNCKTEIKTEMISVAPDDVSSSVENVKSFSTPQPCNMPEVTPRQVPALEKRRISADAASIAVTSLVTLPTVDNFESISNIFELKELSNKLENSAKSSKTIPMFSETSRAAADSTVSAAEDTVQLASYSSGNTSSKNLIKVTLPKATTLKTVKVSASTAQACAASLADKEASVDSSDVFDTVIN